MVAVGAGALIWWEYERLRRQMKFRCRHNDQEEPIIGSELCHEKEPLVSRLGYPISVKFWKSRSKLVKGIMSTLGVILFLVGSLAILLRMEKSKLKSETKILKTVSKPKDEVCLTPSCVMTASHILSSMDLTVDPCEDFYQYSCGGWIAENPAPGGKSTWGTFGKLERQNQFIIKHILENPITKFKSEAEKKAKMYYESCMDIDDTIEKLGPRPLLDLLEEIGGWNISGNFNVSEWSIQNALETLHNEYNMGGLFSWAIAEDDKNSTRYIIKLDVGGLGLPSRENYLNRSVHGRILEAYLSFMTKVGVLLGGERRATRIQMEDVIQFETQLAYITPSEEDLRDDLSQYHLMPVSEMQEIAPFISWDSYLSSAFFKVNKVICPEDVVVVHVPSYFERMSALVLKYLKTDTGKTILNNYLIWQTVRAMTYYLPKPFRDAQRGLQRALMGSDGSEEAWWSCISDTNNVLGFAVGAMFVKQVFQGNAKAEAEEMLREIRSAFIDNMNTLEWMDSETKFSAMMKAASITDMIGFPEFILNPKLLDEKYKDLIIKQDEYFMNNVRFNKWLMLKNLENWDKPVNKSNWDIMPATVNAYYAPTKNQVVFPAGILRSPFYNVNGSASLNFGSMGVVVGHELSHAFDDLGREYDQFGNLHKWWKNGTISEFIEKTKCLARQYSNYEINGRYLNGRQTLGENIADNGGLKTSYYAYLKKPRRELILPGLNMTKNQLFFVSFAQVWCSSSTEEALILQLERDLHSPSKFRVIGPLSNLKEFSKEFNCKLGSKMNPKEKCKIW